MVGEERGRGSEPDWSVATMSDPRRLPTPFGGIRAAQTKKIEKTISFLLQRRRRNWFARKRFVSQNAVRIIIFAPLWYVWCKKRFYIVWESVAKIPPTDRPTGRLLLMQIRNHRNDFAKFSKRTRIVLRFNFEAVARRGGLGRGVGVGGGRLWNRHQPSERFVWFSSKPNADAKQKTTTTKKARGPPSSTGKQASKHALIIMKKNILLLPLFLTCETQTRKGRRELEHGLSEWVRAKWDSQLSEQSAKTAFAVLFYSLSRGRFTVQEAELLPCSNTFKELQHQTSLRQILIGLYQSLPFRAVINNKFRWKIFLFLVSLLWYAFM